MSVADARYVLLTTFTADGRPRRVIVWITGLADGEVGFTTVSDSWKVGRIGRDPRVALQACDSRGRVSDGSVAHTGTARVVDGPEFERVRTLIHRKYWLELAVSRLATPVRRLFGRGEVIPPTDRAVVVRLDA